MSKPTRAGRPSKRSPRSAAPRPWSVPVALADIPDTGRHFDLTADDGTRAAVAEAAGVVGLPRLEASFDLARQGADGLRLTGQVAATVIQNCVVTLEPVESSVTEAVDLVFAQQPETGGAAAKAVKFQPLDAGEPPEALTDGVVDLGAVVTEFLILGIDPYPRRKDAAFAAAPADEMGHRPFAALAALKKGEGPKGQ